MRSIAEFAQQEFVHSTGPYANRRFRRHRQPFSGLYLDTLSAAHRSGLYNTVAITGPRQTGKSQLGYVLTAMYHLFEVRETVILAAPTDDMAADKWREDILPAIEVSRYRDLLPTRGAGSKGSKAKAIKFKNGCTLRFMSAGGKTGRVGVTARVLIVTEADQFGVAIQDSDNPDKFSELLHCTDAFRSRRQVYLECTVTVKSGLIWSKYLEGTASRIVRPCPHCKAWVSPEREHLVGWREAANEVEAGRKAHFVCPSCGIPWTDADRLAANLQGKLIHRGQEILPDGTIVGAAAETSTLGFRWSAVDNQFATAADLGAEEWKAKNARNRENAEKEMRQFVWAIPYEPPEVQLTPLDAEQIRTRVAGLKKGIVPADALGVVLGIDTGKRVLHWDAHAIRASGGVAVIEYGEHPVEADRLGVKAGLKKALGELKAYFERGWSSEAGVLWKPSQVWIDSGWHEHRLGVYEFCRDANAAYAFGCEIYRPAKGYGEGQPRMTRYRAPKAVDSTVLYLGTDYHFSLQQDADSSVILVHINADFWKSELHQRLAMPIDGPLAVVLYEGAGPYEHDDWSHQVAAEIQKEKWIEGRGYATVWEAVERKNHHLDSSYYALGAGDFLRAMIVAAEEQHADRTASNDTQAGLTMPDGRPYMASER